ncbi:MAG: ribbon-helix-helix domain-containing protein [Acidimicrobiia bacterium]
MSGDYSPPGVDLSGFAKRSSAVPPPPLTKPAELESPVGERPSVGSDRPPARRRREPAQRQAPSGPPSQGKLQFFVHLPPEQHAWLRERTVASGWPKREVILEAFLAHRDELRGHDPDAQRRREAGLPPREPGRRKEIGGIPSNVYMGRAEAEVLDRHARELGMSRSQMVSELLRLAAQGPGAKPPGRAVTPRGTTQ